MNVKESCFMKFVCFNTKEPKVGVVYDVLDDLKKECEIIQRG